jgi:hypothetical protein
VSDCGAEWSRRAAQTDSAPLFRVIHSGEPFTDHVR